MARGQWRGHSWHPAMEDPRSVDGRGATSPGVQAVPPAVRHPATRRMSYCWQYRQQYDILRVAGLEPDGDMARKMVFFTRKGADLYAILPGFPAGPVTLEGVSAPAGARVTMLGLSARLDWQPSPAGLRITPPVIAPDELPCRHAFVFKIAGGAAASQ